MTPREANLAIEGHHMQERRDWQKFLRVSAFLGDEASVDDLFSGTQPGSGMTKESYAALKRRMGYGSQEWSDRLEEREKDALEQEARYINDLHGNAPSNNDTEEL